MGIVHKFSFREGISIGHGQSLPLNFYCLALSGYKWERQTNKQTYDLDWSWIYESSQI